MGGFWADGRGHWDRHDRQPDPRDGEADAAGGEADGLEGGTEGDDAATEGGIAPAKRQTVPGDRRSGEAFPMDHRAAAWTSGGGFGRPAADRGLEMGDRGGRLNIERPTLNVQR